MKKLLTLLLAFGFTLAFVACSNTAKTGETAVEEAVEETAETTDEAVEEVAEEAEGTTEEVTEEVVEEADTTALGTFGRSPELGRSASIPIAAFVLLRPL